MKGKFTAGRKALNLLGDGTIEGVADFLRSGQGLSGEQCNELADFFDHTLPYSVANEFKILLKRRKPGPPAPAPGVLETRYFELGRNVHLQLVKNIANGQPHNINRAINDVRSSWSLTNAEKCPSQSALRDYYYFFQEANSLNPVKGPVTRNRKWPPHKNGKLKQLNI